MGHGLGAVKEMGLDAFALRFVSEGWAVLAFDYRHFGASGGEPRQLLSMRRQLEDWASALAYVRGREDIDPGRIAIWGSSFGGGHAIRVAASDPGLAAAVAQCPFTSGLASLRALGLRSTSGVVPKALADVAGGLVGRPPRLVPLVGAPGSAALMTAPDAEPGYRALIPTGLDFEEEVAARIGLMIPIHSPGRAAAKVACPILFSVCDNDSVCPAGPTVRFAGKAPKGLTVRYPIGHFDVYVGEGFERVVADQIEFLRGHLNG
jgi:dienelactone hydrolase